MQQFRIGRTSARFIVTGGKKNPMVEYFQPGRAPKFELFLAGVIALGKKLEVGERLAKEIPAEGILDGHPWGGGLSHRIEYESRPTAWGGVNHDLWHGWVVNLGDYSFKMRRSLAHIHVSSKGRCNGRVNAQLRDLLRLVTKIKESEKSLRIPFLWVEDEGQPQPRLEVPSPEDEEFPVM